MHILTYSVLVVNSIPSQVKNTREAGQMWKTLLETKEGSADKQASSDGSSDLRTL